MRECLGWLTNCAEEKRCPQNWLELAYSELPTSIDCHVCGTSVALVTDEADFGGRAEGADRVAFPVIPCAGGPAAYGGMALKSYVKAPNQIAASATGAGFAPVPKAASEAPPARALVCKLTTGESIPITKEHTIIGRSRTCDVVIASAKVSRQHASVVVIDGKFFIEDLASANGVWRGEEKVNKVEIRHGDVFTISEETIAFEYQ